MIHEDEHLLAVMKPAGVNTHRADTHAQAGIYEWVQDQRPGVSLSILHRLDKATSGVLVFGRSVEANRSLTAQFEQRSVAKQYELIVDRDDQRPPRASCDRDIDGRAASTEFELVASGGRYQRVVARPHSGRTHQVRIHAEAAGMPIVGDVDHGGRDAARVHLHAAVIRFVHPDGQELELCARRPASFDSLLDGDSPDSVAHRVGVAAEARAALFDPADTDAHLWIDRHHDGFPDMRVERLGTTALVLGYADEPVAASWIDALLAQPGIRAVYEQRRPRRGGAGPAELVAGSGPAQFDVTELGLTYRIDLDASPTSSGLFLDQRETRRRLLRSDLGGRTVLNTFAHTGSLSVAAARAGAETLTLDLSKRYLDWARENLRLNDIDPDDHDFIYGDAVEWMERLRKKGRTFDVVLIDPPSSSTPRKGGRRWIVDRDLADLVELGVDLCAGGGTVFVSTNLRKMTWSRFLEHLDRGLGRSGRRRSIETQTVPLDHRSGPGDQPYLRAAWVTLDDAPAGPLVRSDRTE